MGSNWGKNMPHVKVWMYPGRTDEQKKTLTDALETCLKDTLQASSDSISVSIEEVPQENWHDEIVSKEIIEKAAHVTKKPGYPID